MKRTTLLLSLLILAMIPLYGYSAPGNYFVPNKGQVADMKGNKHPEIRYKYEGNGMNIYFEDSKLVYHFIRPEDKPKSEYTQQDWENYRNGNFGAIRKKVYFYRIDLDFVNANSNVRIEADDKEESYSNYYLPACPDGILNVSHYGKIIYRNIYNGIDLSFYFRDGKLKYDFIAEPGADLSQVKLRYDGVKEIEKLASGELVVKTEVADLTEGKPYTYDQTSGAEIPSEYIVNGTTISFQVQGKDIPQPVIIDPTVTWSTYYNNGSSSDTWTKPDFDGTGAFYNAGYTYYTTYPVINAGAGQYFDGTKDGITDLAVVKFASNYSYAWATYYGGDGGEYVSGYTDYGKALATDGSNNVYFGGSTDGTTFPTYNPGGGAFYQDQTRIFSETSFFVKLNSSGVRLWASMYQHEAANTSSGGIRVNGICVYNNYLYFTGQTYRFNSNDIPIRTLAGAYNNNVWKGPQDVFIGRFTPANALEWSSYFNDGGAVNASYRQGCDMTVDNSGNLWFVGRHTVSSSNAGHYLLNPGGGAYYQATNSGDQDLIVTKFNSSLVPVYSTYYGGNDQDIPAMIETNSSGDAVIVLRACRSTNFPVFDPGGGAYYQPTKAYISSFDSDAGIVKLSTSGVRQWATYYGGSAGPSLFSGLGFDNSNNIFVFGSTQASNFPTQSDASSYNDLTMGGTGDVVLLKFTNGGVRQWSTFYGGSGTESLYSPKGEVYSSGCSLKLLSMPYSSSADYPTTDPGGGAFFEGTASTANVNTIFLLEEGAGGMSTAPTSASAAPVSVCSGSPTTLSVSGGSLGAGASWNWYSGSCNGTLVGTGASISVSPSATTTYYVNAVGTCNTTACQSVTVTVNTSSTAPASAGAVPAAICSGGTSTLSVSGGTLGTGASWVWYSGSCGGTMVGTGASITVSPASTTTYYVRAEGPCNNTVCQSVTVTVNTASTAATSASAASPTICTGGNTTLSVAGGSLGTGASWNWYSGSCNGTVVGTGASITVSPSATTTYYVNAAGTCNTTACQSVTVTVNSSSVAPTSASASPTSVCSPASATLSVTGGSLGTGASWNWYSGSCNGTLVGTGASISVSPSATTTYYVNAAGTCNTTVCQSVTVTLNTLSTAPASVTATATTICPGNTTTLTVNGGSLGTAAAWNWYTGSCGGTLVGSGSSITVSPSVTTDYYVRAEGACNNTACQSITINVNSNSTAAASASASSATVCTGNTSTLSITGGSLGTGAVWNWYSGSCNGTLEGTGSSITVTPSATTIYYVNAVGACNTTACQPVTVTVNTLSTDPAAANAAPASICSGGTSTLSVSGGSLGTSSSWTWYTGSCGGTLVGTGSSITVSPTTTTTYYVRAEGPCNNTICQSVTVTVDQPSAAATSINASSTSVCTGNNVTLTVNGGSLGTGAAWNWYSGSCNGILEGSGTSITVPVNANTIFYVNAQGNCNTTACVQVAISTIPGSTLPASLSASANPVCPGSPVTLTMNGGALEPGASWVWYSGSCGGTAEGTGTSITVNPAVTTTYFVRAEGGSCGSSACVSVTVNVNTVSAAPVSASSSVPSVCAGGNVTLTVNGGTVGTGGQYTWYDNSCNGNMIGTGASIVVNPAVATTYYVNIVGTCNTTTCEPVTVSIDQANIAPVSVNANDTNLCTSSAITLSVNGGTLGNGAQWEWYDGACAGTVVGTGSSITVSPTAPTTYYVAATGGCNTTACVAANISAIPVPAAWNAPATPVCSSVATIDLTTLLAASTLTNGTWYGQGVTGTMFDPTGLSGAVTLSYVTGTGLCMDSVAQTITISPAPVSPTTTVSNDSICAGAAVTLNASGSGNGATYNIYDASTGGALLGSAPLVVTPGSTTTYYVEAVDTAGCSNDGGRQPIVIVASPLPNADAGPDQVLCAGGSVTITATGGGTYTWSTGVTGASINVSPVSDSMYVVTVDVNGCTNMDSVSVDVITSADVAAANDNATTTEATAVTINVAANDSGDVSTITVLAGPYNGTATVDANGQIVYTPQSGFSGTDTITYSICNTSCGNICTTATVYVLVDKEISIHIPGGISPNGDGINDVLNIQGIDNYPENTLLIFNRWGDEVYSASPYRNDWKGQSNNSKLKVMGDEVVDGTYFYILKLTPDDKGMNGTIELIRK